MKSIALVRKSGKKLNKKFGNQIINLSRARVSATDRKFTYVNVSFSLHLW